MIRNNFDVDGRRRMKLLTGGIAVSIVLLASVILGSVLLLLMRQGPRKVTSNPAGAGSAALVPSDDKWTRERQSDNWIGKEVTIVGKPEVVSMDMGDFIDNVQGKKDARERPAIILRFGTNYRSEAWCMFDKEEPRVYAPGQQGRDIEIMAIRGTVSSVNEMAGIIMLGKCSLVSMQTK